MIEEAVNGGDYKASVRVASTVAINLAAPGANIDGIAMVAGDRFLEKDNATLADRGIYIWNGAAVPATRAADADDGAEFNGGAIIPVEEGTINRDTNWQLTNDGPVTIGATPLSFKKVESSTFGKQTIEYQAGSMSPRLTNGPQFVTVQLGANGTLLSALAFDAAVTEYAQFQVRMPKSWNEGAVTFTPIWTANSTSTNGVAWVIRAKAIGNDETIDAAWGAGVTVTDANTATAYQAHIAAESGDVTIANAGELEWVVFEIYRDVNHASDTLAVDALLTEVTINYTTDAATDA